MDDQAQQLEDALAQLAGAVGDVLDGWDAHRQLASGHTGMGHNILTEAAGQYRSVSCWIRVRRHYDAACALLSERARRRAEG